MAALNWRAKHEEHGLLLKKKNIAFIRQVQEIDTQYAILLFMTLVEYQPNLP